MFRMERRDFLKLSAAMLGGAALSSLAPLAGSFRRDSAKLNIIILLLDTLSARNLSLYGYGRATTPNLERIAALSTVYHNHYSAGNFTTPGTASGLMGLYPWTHRAFIRFGLVDRSLADRNIFGLVGEDHYKLAFSQNPISTLLLSQFSEALDKRIPEPTFAFHRNLSMLEENFPRDYAEAFLAFEDMLSVNQFNDNPASLSIGLADRIRHAQSQKKTAPPGSESDKYPVGNPSNYQTEYTLDALFSGLVDTLLNRSESELPLFAYLHLYPPHSPYSPRQQFLELFKTDGFEVRKKPPHPLSAFRYRQDVLTTKRLYYDAFIADVDSEVGTFVDRLEAAGILDSSYLLITSDHGELFERAEWGHGTPLMYESVIKIPLLIRAPGQTERRDVHAVTSNVDLVPTLLALAGKEIPTSLEGRLLPGFGGMEDSERSVYSVFAKKNSAFAPLDKSVVAMVKGRYKVIYYRGYPKYNERFEIYDLEEDPEELRDLSNLDNPTANGLKEEMLEAAHAADLPYQRSR